MGKRTRRNKHRQSSNKHQQQNQSNKKKTSRQTGPTIVQRIRHADPKTRHAALAALLHTSFHPDTLQQQQQQTSNNSKNKNKKTTTSITSNLLQAVRNQVMDSDLDCATAAAGCLANYAAFSNNHSQDAATITAGWMVLLTGRLQQGLQRIVELVQQQQQSQISAPKQQQRILMVQWYRLMEQCLTGLVHLLENNLLAMERLIIVPSSSSASVSQLCKDFMLVLTELLQQTTNSTTTTTTQPTASAAAAAVASKPNAPNDDTNNHDEAALMTTALQAVQVNVQTLVCRCLHSAWDDNPQLLLPWLEQEPATAQQTLQLLQTVIVLRLEQQEQQFDSTVSTTTTTNQAMIGRVHAVGAWIAAWTQCRQQQQQEVEQQQQQQQDGQEQQQQQPLFTCTTAAAFGNTDTAVGQNQKQQLQNCLSVLVQSLQQWKVDEYQARVQQLQAAYALYQQQQADQTLERRVVAAQDLKKEPARLIAKRLKRKQEEEKAAAATGDMAIDNDNTAKGGDHDDTAMQTADDEQNNNSIDDDDDDWETVLFHWQESVRPLQIALEITANLTSVSSQSPLFHDEMDDDQAMMMMEDDQVMEPPDIVGTIDPELTQLLFQHSIPDHLLQLLNKLVASNNNSNKKDGDDDSQETLLDELRDPLSDLQSKTAVCVGHCLTNLAAADEEDAPRDTAATLLWTPPNTLWSNLKSAWHAAVDPAAQQAVGSLMVVALSSSKSVRTTQIQSADLDFLLLQLLQQQQNNNHGHNNSAIAVRDAICMLGILCSQESHPAEVNHKVVQALMLAAAMPPTKSGDSDDTISAADDVSAMVLSEVLRVLMDIYGDDDCHPDVFNSLHVLNFFQRALPVLKQRIVVEQQQQQQQQQDDDAAASPEDIDLWQETAMNAARFIQYKKGHET